MNRTRLALIMVPVLVVPAAILSLFAACNWGARAITDASSSARLALESTSELDSTSEAPTAHNRSDVSFAQAMVSHHEVAIEMADLAQKRARSEEVRSLAERISAGKVQNVKQLRIWLVGWGESHRSGTDTAPMVAQDMARSAPRGVMERLRTTSGTDFDRIFLRLMIVHHQQVQALTQREVEDGQSIEAAALAKEIMATERAEVAEMRAMLRTGG